MQTDERTPAAIAEKQHAGSRQAGQRQQLQRKRSRGPGKRSSGSSERPAGSGEASGGQSERSTRLVAGGTKQSPQTAGNGRGNTGAAVAEKAKPREQSRASAALLAEAADVEAQLEVAAAADSGAAATAEPLLADHEWLNRCRKVGHCFRSFGLWAPYPSVSQCLLCDFLLLLGEARLRMNLKPGHRKPEHPHLFLAGVHLAGGGRRVAARGAHPVCGKGGGRRLAGGQRHGRSSATGAVP